MASCHVETGFQLFARLSARPSLKNLCPVLFPNYGPFRHEIIEILGDSSAGKTLLITELIAKCLLPDHIGVLDIGGKSSGAIIMNTDHHFHIFKLISIMENMLRKCGDENNRLSSTMITEIINTTLKNLIVLNCFDSQQMYVTFHNLENILSNNNKISLIVLDSLTAYYWSDRLNGGIRKMDLYQKNILKSLQNMTKEFNLVIMFTKSGNFSSKGEIHENCCKQPTLEKINYRINLLSVSEKNDHFVAHVTLPDNSKIEKFYKISNSFEWIDLDSS